MQVFEVLIKDQIATCVLSKEYDSSLRYCLPAQFIFTLLGIMAKLCRVMTTVVVGLPDQDSIYNIWT